MVAPLDAPEQRVEQLASYRLISSRFPPITLFEDVADADDFEALYQLQALTNPRLLAEAGDLGLIPRDEIPFGIRGCSYAVAPFTHVNPDGSRFSDGAFGVLYLAESMATAIAEVRYHKQRYLSRVEGLRYDRLVFRALMCGFSETLLDLTRLPPQHAIYDPEDYSASHALGVAARQRGTKGLIYHSVRNPGAICWALFTPRGVKSMVQSAHYEMIWDGEEISSVHRISKR
ncbi:RES family NAD+ phosphorylase [Marinimicrobium sp. C6131]|uniref:RES family NAD+ phosphorylase n=1 Tax=Marinimicrobium sp. C6131 TaxID=3022676 RepID=UPI00223CD0A9|nr:RES family NAD+ phosphorylase [Marinimicrobium sp. C6131]UZJ46035.1 RES family NAD+ phosphorylase [Marinimicrobium sp. C6131]